MAATAAATIAAEDGLAVAAVLAICVASVGLSAASCAIARVLPDWAAARTCAASSSDIAGVSCANEKAVTKETTKARSRERVFITLSKI
jgi:hypothetical protein